ncbi:MAG: hypothetical protein Ta2D_11270 [Rickettsiales bacterium]|nr:MAG: hypothetical protein Ta2D_11270 [Rickettsiales bacterium]
MAKIIYFNEILKKKKEELEIQKIYDKIQDKNILEDWDELNAKVSFCKRGIRENILPIADQEYIIDMVKTRIKSVTSDDIWEIARMVVFLQNEYKKQGESLIIEELQNLRKNIEKELSKI